MEEEDKKPAPDDSSNLSKGDDIDKWIESLSNSDLPALNETVQRISKVASSHEANASELAKSVLRDPSVSAKVLKIANSTSYNPTGVPINTISRAVIVLGFDTIQSIALSVALLDSLGTHVPRERLLHEIAQSFHAAHQAECIAKEAKDPHPEEIFIATLLNKLGDMAFWACGSPAADELDAILAENPDKDLSEVQEKVLGFRLKNLGVGLAKSWNLGESVTEAMNTADGSNSRWEMVNLSYKVAQESIHGWNSKELESTIQNICNLTGKETSEMKRFLQNNANDAINRLRSSSPRVAHIAKLIPSAKDEKMVGGDTNAEGQAVAESLLDDETPEFPDPDPKLQLSILQELMQLTTHKEPDINLVFQMTLEGLYRGVGMDRALMAILSPQKDVLKTKYLLESKPSRLREAFQINIKKNKQYEFFVKLLAEHDYVWICNKAEPAKYRPLLNSHVTTLIGTHNGFVAPILVGPKPIGIFYCDRKISGRKLDEEGFNAFSLFVQQANMCLLSLMSRRKK